MADHRSLPWDELKRVVDALQGAINVIDDYDPDRNPARCMRQIRRLLTTTDVRIAVGRLSNGLPDNVRRS